MVLMYRLEYRTFTLIRATYGVSEATACRMVQRFEKILVQDPRFHLSGKKALHRTDTLFEVVLIDATEVSASIRKKQRCYYCGKKKSHTNRAQLIQA